MDYILLALAAAAVMMQDVFKKKFNQKSQGGVLFFSGMIAMFACLFFVAVNRDWSYHGEMLPYSLGFAASYAIAMICIVLAIRHGSLAKTGLIVSCSLLVPSFYGILFLREEPRLTLLVGIAVLVVALVMINYEKSSERATWKWVLFVCLAFIGNGMCSTVQKMEALRFGEAGKNMFMIVALGIVTVVLFLAALMTGQERKQVKETVQKGWLLALLCGGFNGLCNYLVIYLNTRFDASVMFPVISAGSVVLVFIYATVIGREKFNLRQKLGFLLGVISIVLLNL